MTGRSTKVGDTELREPRTVVRLGLAQQLAKRRSKRMNRQEIQGGVPKAAQTMSLDGTHEKNVFMGDTRFRALAPER